jgi:hypothetical protein
MTLFGRISTYFPLLHILLLIFSLAGFVLDPGLTALIAILVIAYLLPPLLLRLYSLKYPPEPGKWILNRPERCDWWIAHQLQLSYAVVPLLESLLRLIPGAYSSWLRLWGSKVGKNIYWTPRVEILDRHMMVMGNNIVFGHRVVCCSHIINQKQNGDLVLILQPVNIGSDSLIGAGAHLGPGVQIPEKTNVPYHAKQYFKKSA